MIGPGDCSLTRANRSGRPPPLKVLATAQSRKFEPRNDDPAHLMAGGPGASFVCGGDGMNESPLIPVRMTIDDHDTSLH